MKHDEYHPDTEASARASILNICGPTVRPKDTITRARHKTVGRQARGRSSCKSGQHARRTRRQAQVIHPMRVLMAGRRGPCRVARVHDKGRGLDGVALVELVVGRAKGMPLAEWSAAHLERAHVRLPRYVRAWGWWRRRWREIGRPRERWQLWIGVFRPRCREASGELLLACVQLVSLPRLEVSWTGDGDRAR